MPFPQPAFPSSFDVGTPGGPHVHMDSTGVYAINGSQQIILAPQSPINPNAVALEFFTGNETVPGLIYEILDVGIWGPTPGGDAIRLEAFASEFASGITAALELESGSRDGTHGSQATLQATDHTNNYTTHLILDGETATAELKAGKILGAGALTWDGTALTVPGTLTATSKITSRTDLGGLLSVDGAGSGLPGAIIRAALGQDCARFADHNGAVKVTVDDNGLLLSNGGILRGLIGYSEVGASATETTASGTFTDLATFGPSCNVTVGPSGTVAVIMAAQMQAASGAAAVMSVSIDGNAASDNNSVVSTGSNDTQCGITIPSGLTPGTRSFVAKYRTTSGTSGFLRRAMLVIPL